MATGTIARAGWNRLRQLVRLCALLCVLGAYGCAADKAFVWVSTQHLPTSGPEKAFVIEAGDSIAIQVYNDAVLSTTTTVRSDGYIGMLLIGEIVAEGKRPVELAKDIETALAKFVTAPAVVVVVQQVHTINVVVTGEVGTPGVLPVAPGTRVREVLAQAGGLTDFADDTRIYLIKKSSAERIRMTEEMLEMGNSVASALPVGDGDLILVE